MATEPEPDSPWLDCPPPVTLLVSGRSLHRLVVCASVLPSGSPGLLVLI